MSHNKRMQQLGRLRLPPSNSREYQLLELEKLDLRFRAQANEWWERAKARVVAQQENGAQLPMGETLRDFLVEYNSRTWERGIDSMPLNFNIMEAFFRFRLPEGYFSLCSEEDHIFDIPGFVDFFTLESERLNACVELATLLEDSVIYSFDICSSIADWHFDVGKRRFALCGASMIRSGPEVSMVLLLGEKTDLEAASRELVERWNNREVLHEKPDITPDPSLKIEAVPVLGSKEHHRILALARIDLPSSTMDERCILFDHGTSYTVLTDRFISEISERDRGELAAQHNELLSVYDIVRTAMLLPSYFHTNLDSIVVEKVETRLFKKAHVAHQKTLDSS